MLLLSGLRTQGRPTSPRPWWVSFTVLDVFGLPCAQIPLYTPSCCSCTKKSQCLCQWQSLELCHFLLQTYQHHRAVRAPTPSDKCAFTCTHTRVLPAACPPAGLGHLCFYVHSKGTYGQKEHTLLAQASMVFRGGLSPYNTSLSSIALPTADGVFALRDGN